MSHVGNDSSSFSKQGCLDRIEQVGFSLLSAGIFRGECSLEQVLSIGIKSIHTWGRQKPDDTSLSEVYVFGFTPQECKTLKRICNKSFGMKNDEEEEDESSDVDVEMSISDDEDSEKDNDLSPAKSKDDSKTESVEENPNTKVASENEITESKKHPREDADITETKETDELVTKVAKSEEHVENPGGDEGKIEAVGEVNSNQKPDASVNETNDTKGDDGKKQESSEDGKEK